MANCKECLHDEVFPMPHLEDASICQHFKDSKKWIEQIHAKWETVTEIKNNTVCGDGVNIRYKRCSHCKKPMGLTGDDFCGKCGAKMDL